MKNKIFFSIFIFFEGCAVLMSSPLSAELFLTSKTVAVNGKSKEIRTSAIVMAQPPSWLLKSRVEKITTRIQNKLEWNIRQITVSWYINEADFQKVHTLGPSAVAVTKTGNNIATIHMSQAVNTSNFDMIFGHELAHVIIFQKYHGGVPRWLEEGIANFVSNYPKVDYKWLASQPFLSDVRVLSHPFSGTIESIRYRYNASQALAEMLDKKCHIDNLIRLSIGRDMEKYIPTYCGINDINQEFNNWVNQNAHL
jgi:hypothetical protein